MFKFLIVALAYAGIAFGGQMNLNMASPTDTALIKDFLTRIDSITFVQGKSPNVDDSLFMKVYHNDSDKQSLNYPLSCGNLYRLSDAAAKVITGGPLETAYGRRLQERLERKERIT